MPVAEEMTVKDFGRCNDCGCFFDLWKYGDVKASGHEGCNWRYVTEDELKECVDNCKEPYPRCQNCDTLNVGLVLDEGGKECPDCGATISKKSVNWVNCFTDC